MRHKRKDSIYKVESKKEGRMLLCRNKAADRPSFLDFSNENIDAVEDVALDYLAEILVDIFLSKEYEQHRKQKERSHLLPGFDERASG